MTASRRAPAETPPAGSTSVIAVAVVVSIISVLVGLLSVGSGSGSDPPRPVTAPIDATVAAAPSRALPTGFLGLSLETTAVESYAGTDPTAPDPVFVALVHDLMPDRPVVRIGGDTADWTWWPVSGLSRPRGVYISLDETWVAVTRALTRALGARLILGLNLEADSAAIAAAEAAHLRAGLDPASVMAFELGNEPSIYSQYPWYRTGVGTGVPGRPPGWNYARFQADFARVSAAVSAPVLAGPSVGGPGWFPDLGAFLAAEPRVGLVTVHRYPLQLCRTPPSSARYPSLAHLLSPLATTGFADSFAPAVAAAHAHGRPLRIDELNSVSCGAAPAVSHSFAAALWVLDTLFALARTGVDGVQIHTFPGAGYELFARPRSRARPGLSVAPEYYGLRMFAEAAPAGSQLFPVASMADPQLGLWATRGRDGRTRVVLVNLDPVRARTVRLALTAPEPHAPASLERLRAPSVRAADGATLGGRSFGAVTTTGRLAGRAVRERVLERAGRYVVRLPSGSAALLTIG